MKNKKTKKKTKKKKEKWVNPYDYARYHEKNR